jgi:hypothetical protein
MEDILNLTIEEIEAKIAELKSNQVLAPIGVVIESYWVDREYEKYQYYRLVDSKGRFLLHLGNADSYYVQLWREAISNRKILINLVKRRKELLTPTNLKRIKKFVTLTNPNIIDDTLPRLNPRSPIADNLDPHEPVADLKR